MSQQNSTKWTAEVISIGDEMTSGARLDTNAQWLSQRLAELGIEVLFHTTVCDTLAHNVNVFQTAARRVDFVVCTGGLGPTRDDLTREALSEVASDPLELRKQALDHIETLFSSRGRPMSERNRLQAMFPSTSTIIPNPLGTAPGIDLRLREDASDHVCRVFALPGVPAEMMPMFDQYVAPSLVSNNGDQHVIRSLVMKFFGTGESAMEERLGDTIARDRQPRVGITVSAATISLRITAHAETAQECEAMIADTKTEILGRVPEYYFGDGENYEQYHAIDSSLRSRGESLMVVELGYAAPLNDWFASLGDTPSYRGGLSLANERELRRHTSASALAEAITQLKSQFDVDWLLLVDGYPSLNSPLVREPSETMPNASVKMLVSSPDGVLHERKSTIAGHPDILQPRIGKTAMEHLRAVMAATDLA
ncbi:putative competence-damage inducible protein [Novipirellula aureliae]|uniref:Putative competence-damage inducible protein n=2 Tax=Novipirellula aureliae TaxID=2527966 RepID=A0A5C6EBH0_9BACT|nr:putative competence-damage inducible protein [Novipirellula aureliae]